MASSHHIFGVSDGASPGSQQWSLAVRWKETCHRCPVRWTTTVLSELLSPFLFLGDPKEVPGADLHLSEKKASPCWPARALQSDLTRMEKPAWGTGMKWDLFLFFLYILVLLSLIQEKMGRDHIFMKTDLLNLKSFEMVTDCVIVQAILN